MAKVPNPKKMGINAPITSCVIKNNLSGYYFCLLCPVRPPLRNSGYSLSELFLKACFSINRRSGYRTWVNLPGLQFCERNFRKNTKDWFSILFLSPIRRKGGNQARKNIYTIYMHPGKQQIARKFRTLAVTSQGREESYSCT